MKTLLTFTVLALAGTSLAGCGAMDRIEAIGKSPTLAPVGNPANKEIVDRIPQLPPISHANNSLWQAGAKSFFHDPRASHVGDVITVTVTVADTAKLSNSHGAHPYQLRRRQPDQLFGVESILPTAMSPGSLVKMGSDTANTGTGAISRSRNRSI